MFRVTRVTNVRRPARPWVRYAATALIAMSVGFGMGSQGHPDKPTAAEAAQLAKAQSTAPAGWVCWLEPHSGQTEREVICAAG